MFPDRIAQARALRWGLLAVVAGSVLAHTASALDPPRDLTQYVHDRWEADRGFPGGAVFAICQSTDGYLWIGTERGLVRFDGFDFTLIQHPLSGPSPIGPVRGLVTDAQGNTWIRLDGPHLLLYRNGKFEDAAARITPRELAFTAMALDSRGELLLWGPRTRLLRYHQGAFHNFAVTPDIPGIVLSIAATSDGRLWLGTRDIGLVTVDPSHSMHPEGTLTRNSINALSSDTANSVWIGTDSGLMAWNGSGPARPQSLPPVDILQILSLLKDRQGNLWAGTVHGLVRIPSNSIVSTNFLHPNMENGITAIFEDRDGELWFGGSHGIERLREGIFTSFTRLQGLPSDNNGPVYVDAEGRTWFAPPTGGLYWLRDGRVSHVTVAGLDKDVIYSISGGGGELWLARQHGGLTVLTGPPETPHVRTWTTADGLAQNSVYSVHRNRDGTIWAGTVSAGLSRLRSGVITNFSPANGMQSSAVFSIVEGYDGTMWFATPSGVDAFSGGHWKNYSASDDLPSSNVRSIFEDSRHVLWIATSGGLALLSSGRIVLPRGLTDSLREETLGIAEDRQGSLWIATSDHVLAVNRDRLLSGTLTDSDVLSFGAEDGLPGSGGVRRDRSVAADSAGRIWISLARGLAVADPEHAAAGAVPVNVRMESITAAGHPVDLGSAPKAGPRLAPGTRSITFNYADSNLSVPQRIRFRYRLDSSNLDSSDPGWSSDLPSRQVIYTNLAPGAYRFRIIASNAMGQWNGQETVVPFVVEPAFWQTWWFRLACFAALCLIILGLYRLRLYQLTRQLNLRFQERLAERNRIAQELHDTLLQGVLSASLQLDLAEDQLPENSPARPLLRRVLQLMAKVTDEGRNALRGLRAQETDDRGLELAFSRIRQEFALDEAIGYRVIVNSPVRPVRPLIRDEVYRIGREALVNAFIHARAQSIEVEVEYASMYLRVLVRDDGCGIDPEVLHTGREGHWGLLGMRERSQSIGSVLKLRSRLGSGTEVELTVPGDIAFEGRSVSPISQWLPWLSRERFKTRTQEIAKSTVETLKK